MIQKRIYALIWRLIYSRLSFRCLEHSRSSPVTVNKLCVSYETWVFYFSFCNTVHHNLVPWHLDVNCVVVIVPPSYYCKRWIVAAWDFPTLGLILQWPLYYQDFDITLQNMAAMPDLLLVGYSSLRTSISVSRFGRMLQIDVVMSMDNYCLS